MLPAFSLAPITATESGLKKLSRRGFLMVASLGEKFVQ